MPRTRPTEQQITRRRVALVRLTNIRLGLATNSSSSHSMIRVSEHAPLAPEELTYNFGEDEDTLCVTSEQKRRYLAAQMWNDVIWLWHPSGELYPRDWDMDRRWYQEKAALILELCGLPEQDNQALRNSDMGDLQSGVFTHGFRIPTNAGGTQLLNMIPRENGPGSGPQMAFVAWALQLCEDPEIIITSYDWIDERMPEDQEDEPELPPGAMTEEELQRYELLRSLALPRIRQPGTVRGNAVEAYREHLVPAEEIIPRDELD